MYWASISKSLFVLYGVKFVLVLCYIKYFFYKLICFLAIARLDVIFNILTLYVKTLLPFYTLPDLD